MDRYSITQEAIQLGVGLSDDEPFSLTQQMMEALSPRDPGMNQREYSGSELEDDYGNMVESVEERNLQEIRLLTMRRRKHQMQVELHVKMMKSQTLTTV